jgi:hypothetical protein
MFKVGLILPLRGTWRGGLNYFHNLLSCYRQYPDRALHLEVFTDLPEEIARYRCAAIDIHSCPEARLLSLRRPMNWPRRLVNRVFAYDPVSV